MKLLRTKGIALSNGGPRSPTNVMHLDVSPYGLQGTVNQARTGLVVLAVASVGQGQYCCAPAQLLGGEEGRAHGGCPPKELLLLVRRAGCPSAHRAHMGCLCGHGRTTLHCKVEENRVLEARKVRVHFHMVKYLIVRSNVPVWDHAPTCCGVAETLRTS